MIILKKADKMFEKLGYEKTEDKGYFVRYEKRETAPEYVHYVDILHKKSERHIVQSYDPNLADTIGLGNTCVGLTEAEMKACLRKVKELGW